MSEHRPYTGPAVECSDVHKHFGGDEVLRGIHLVVEQGEFVALSGPSGGGKSTLLHLLAALDRPTAGRIVVAGHDLTELRAVNRYRRLEVGIVFQLHNLLPHMSAGRNVELAMFGTHLSAQQRKARSADLLEQLDLSNTVDRSPTRLSGGERQRVAIARAIANNPRLLLADEPTGNLDPGAADTVIAVFERLRERGNMSIVLVTHDPLVGARADRQLVLDDGTVHLAPSSSTQPAQRSS